MTGMKMMTTGVLLRMAESTPAVTSAMAIAMAPDPPRAARTRAGRSIASVANSPCPMMRSASTVASAGLAKPASRLPGAIVPPASG